MSITCIPYFKGTDRTPRHHQNNSMRTATCFLLPLLPTAIFFCCLFVRPSTGFLYNTAPATMSLGRNRLIPPVHQPRSAPLPSSSPSSNRITTQLTTLEEKLLHEITSPLPRDSVVATIVEQLASTQRQHPAKASPFSLLPL